MLLNNKSKQSKAKRRVSFAPKCELAIYQPDATDADTAETCDDTTLSSNDSLDEGSSSSLVAQHYRLGDCIRSQHHMVQHPFLEDTIQSVYALQLSEFAWIKRKNGDWTYCKLVERTNNTNGRGDDDVVMTFLVDNLGHKKRLRPAYWVHMVRTCSAGVRSVYYKDAIAAIDKLHTKPLSILRR
jgi:hypothetical protein